MRKRNFALRLRESLLSALRRADYFQERAGRGEPKRALELLKRTGVGRPPDVGDEIGAE